VVHGLEFLVLDVAIRDVTLGSSVGSVVVHASFIFSLPTWIIVGCLCELRRPCHQQTQNDFP
jgi:hypothetical protein